MRAAVQDPAVDPQVRQPPDVRVRHDLERQRGERLGIVGSALDVLVLLEREVALDGWDVERARQVVDDRVQHQLHALVLERRPTEDGHARPGQRHGTDGLVELVGGGLLFVDELLHQLLVVLGELLEELVAGRGGGLQVLGRDLRVHPVLAHVALPVVGVELDEVDHAVQVGLGPPRELQDQRVGVQPVHHHLDGALEVRAGAVHLVHEGDAGDVVAVGLTPDGLGLRLDAGDRVEHGDRAVQHAERPLDLDGEVDVARRVDDVDPVALPLAGGGRRGDRDAPLALLRHPVHHRRALVHLADLVGPARVVEDPLGRRGLAGVDVRHDPDVARASQRVLADREPLAALLDVLFGRRHVHRLRGARHQRTPSPHGTRPEGRVGRSSSITSGSARRPGWPRPSCACPRVA